jgi:hypothetical protein
MISSTAPATRLKAQFSMSRRIWPLMPAALANTNRNNTNSSSPTRIRTNPAHPQALTRSDYERAARSSKVHPDREQIDSAVVASNIDDTMYITGPVHTVSIMRSMRRHSTVPAWHR